MAEQKNARGNASQFFVAGELCRRGYSAVVTIGNTPNIDVLCSNVEGTKFVHIQVKTYDLKKLCCPVSQKAEIDYGANFFWALCGVPHLDENCSVEYYIIPSKEMAVNISKANQKWVNSPGIRVIQRKNTNMRTVYLPPKCCYGGWNLSEYQDRWDLIEERLIN